MARTLRLVRRNRKASMNRKKVIGKKSKVARKKGTRRHIRLVKGGNGKKILLIIDPQNDFIPGSYDELNEYGTKGPSLAVPNAHLDMRRLVNFLENKPTEFDEIHVSLDSHTKTHIAHLGFWQLRPEQESELKAYGVVGFRLNPEPTGAEEINAEKVNIELYNMKTAETIPGYENIMPRGVVTINGVEKQIDQNQLKKLAVDYINKLTQLHNIYNKPLPTTWPDHCIIGTKGWRIYEPLASVLNSKFKGKVYIHEKGTNDLVEMYSIFKAEVPYPDLYPRNIVNDYKDATVPKPNTTVNDPNTNRNYATTLNKDFITQLRGANNENIVYVCGEAKTHCVKTSAEDLVGDNGKNVIMLYNVMSDITDPDIYVEPRKKVFGELKDKGVEFAQIIEGVIVMVDDYDPNNDNPEIPPQQ